MSENELVIRDIKCGKCEACNSDVSRTRNADGFNLCYSCYHNFNILNHDDKYAEITNACCVRTLEFIESLPKRYVARYMLKPINYS